MSSLQPECDFNNPHHTVYILRMCHFDEFAEPTLENATFHLHTKLIGVTDQFWQIESTLSLETQMYFWLSFLFVKKSLRIPAAMPFM